MAFEEHEEDSFNEMGNIDALKVEFIADLDRAVGSVADSKFAYFAYPFLKELKLLIEITREKLNDIDSCSSLRALQTSFEHEQKDIYGKLLQQYMVHNPTVTELLDQKKSLQNTSFFRFCQKIESIIETHYRELCGSVIPNEFPIALKDAVDRIIALTIKHMEHSKIQEATTEEVLSHFKIEVKALLNNWNLCQKLMELISLGKEEALPGFFTNKNEYFKEKIRKLLHWIHFYNEKKERLQKNRIDLENVESLLKTRSKNTSYGRLQTNKILGGINRIIKNAVMLFDTDVVDLLIEIKFQDFDEDSEILGECEHRIIDFNNVFIDEKDGLVIIIGDSAFLEVHNSSIMGSDLVRMSLDDKPRKKFSDWLDEAYYFPDGLSKNNSQRIYVNGNDNGELAIDDKFNLYFQGYRSISHLSDSLIPNFFSNRKFIKILYMNQIHREYEKLISTDFSPVDEKKHNI